jgi:hypothetical protein
MRDLQLQVQSLARDVRRLRAGVALLTVILGILALSGFQRGAERQVLRARGLVIVDEQGRERILIGAPVPASRQRVRTDTARARRAWAARFPRQYMEWYRGYRHDMHGVLVLNEAGFDVVAVGDSLPDPNIGRRIASHAGLIFNTAEGEERGGIGVQRSAAGYSAGLGLDSPTQSDAIGLWVSERRGVYLSVSQGAASGRFGAFPLPRGVAPESSRFEFGLLIRQGDTVRHRLTASSP